MIDSDSGDAIINSDEVGSGLIDPNSKLQNLARMVIEDQGGEPLTSGQKLEVIEAARADSGLCWDGLIPYYCD